MNRSHDVSSVLRPLMLPRLSAVLLAASVAFAGCRDGDAPRLVEVYPVHGQIFLAGGKPLSGGRIYFVPTKDALIVSSGEIGSDGRFSLATGTSGEGAPPGEFKVRIEPEPLPRAPVGAVARGVPKRLPFAFRYTDEDASGLLVTVRPGTNDLEPFHLR